MWERSWAGVVVGIEWNPGVETTTDTHAMFADTSWGVGIAICPCLGCRISFDRGICLDRNIGGVRRLRYDRRSEAWGECWTDV